LSANHYVNKRDSDFVALTAKEVGRTKISCLVRAFCAAKFSSCRTKTESQAIRVCILHAANEISSFEKMRGGCFGQLNTRE
jgi:hypothetical protein